MKFDGVVLYGPPGSGKDTVTAELSKLSSAYIYFKKLKVGGTGTGEYRSVTEQQLAELRSRGLVVHEVQRYGATYAVDATSLDEYIDDKRIPVVHMGQVSGIDALRQHRGNWLDVLLWCSEHVAAERIQQRGSVDIDDRLAAWRETVSDLGSAAEPRFTISVRTDAVLPATTAEVVHVAMMGTAMPR